MPYIKSKRAFAAGYCKREIAQSSDTITLTQEFLSEMLGVRRTSVTEVAIKIQATGAISYSRGIIKIIDLEAVKDMTCECYETLLEQTSGDQQGTRAISFAGC